MHFLEKLLVDVNTVEYGKTVTEGAVEERHGTPVVPRVCRVQDVAVAVAVEVDEVENAASA